MQIEGGCYCGSVRYRAEGEPLFRVHCYCRICQFMSGGSPNVVMGMPEDGFVYTEGAPEGYSPNNSADPATREFCPKCGTHLLGRSPERPQAVFLKVGTFDDPSLFGGPEAAMFLCEKQSFHHVPEGVPTFERGPTQSED
ncbi:GFA family protein [Myxococcota bacterium]|nr:GFA family protein [Myxococcota bacterium]